MVLLNEMTPVWSLYLSFGVIVIFSNAAVLGSQLKQRTTEESTTNPFHYMITQKQNESSTRPISATPGTHPSDSENTTSSSVRYETTTPEHVRLESTAGYSSSAFTPEQSPMSTQRVTHPSERTNEKSTSKELQFATSPLTPVHSSIEPTSISIHPVTHTQNREQSEMTTSKTVRPDSTTFPATISYTENPTNVTSPLTSSIQPEMEKDKTGKIKTKMKKVLLATKLAQNRQTLVKDTMVVTIPPTVNWTPTESYTSERNLPSSLSTKNMTEPESNFPPISLKKLTTEGGTTSPSLDATEYDQTIRDTSTSMSTTFQTTNALKFNVTYYEAVKPTKFSPRFPNTSIPLSTVTPLAMTVAALRQSSFSNTNFANVAANDEQRSLNKERSQFPGITLKVSHVLIPKQKRNAFSSLPDAFHRAEMLRKARIAAKSSNRKSNCTRSPVQVVTAADSESNEKVNLTEEHYDCEFLSELRSTQKENEEDSIHTFYGGYVFRYTIPKQTNDSAPNRTTSTESTRATTVMSTTIEENDDYDSSYVEYSDPANTNTTNSTDVVDDGVFPNPELNARKVPLEVKLELSSSPTSESSMLDNDLHDHDVIDSVMYIYFGGATHGQKGAGRQIIIVGAVIALVAQFLTLASSLRRIKTHKGEEATVILLNIETALTLTNLIFLLGVQSTSNHTLCKLTAVLLFYFHLVIIIWFGLSSIYSVQVVCQKKPTSCTFLKYCFGAWLLPLLLTSLNYAFNERSFETSSYCWISPLRGVLISFILPVFVLSLMCVVLTLYGLKHGVEPLDEVDDTYSHRKLLRLTAVSLPIFSVTWFTGMVTLENSASLLYSLIFLISDTVLNWLLFACWLPSEASQWKDMDEDYYDEEEDFDDEPVIIKRRFDDQPLLSELYEYGAQGQLYNLKVEPISIIHTP